MSKRKYFGTDGIRGLANSHPMTAEVALHIILDGRACQIRDKQEPSRNVRREQQAKTGEQPSVPAQGSPNRLKN